MAIEVLTKWDIQREGWIEQISVCLWKITHVIFLLKYQHNDTCISMNRRLYCTWAIVTSAHVRITIVFFSHSTRLQKATRAFVYGFSSIFPYFPHFCSHRGKKSGACMCNSHIERNDMNMYLTRGFWCFFFFLPCRCSWKCC